MPDKHIEVEVKFWVEELKPVRDRLVELGATLVGERLLETNLRLDRPDRSLSQSQQALRLRWTSPALSPTGLKPGAGGEGGDEEGESHYPPLPQRGRGGQGGEGQTCCLTYKALPAEPLSGSEPDAAVPAAWVKERLEIEVEVTDLDAMRAILEKLGFETIFIYEKYRETFHLAGTEVALDELPYGCFVEIEGEAGDIERAAAQLGLRSARRVPDTYMSLFEAVQRRLGLPFRDLTFDNFRQVVVTPEDLGLSLPSFPAAEEVR